MAKLTTAPITTVAIRLIGSSPSRLSLGDRPVSAPTLGHLTGHLRDTARTTSHSGLVADLLQGFEAYRGHVRHTLEVHLNFRGRHLFEHVRDDGDEIIARDGVECAEHTHRVLVHRDRGYALARLARVLERESRSVGPEGVLGASEPPPLSTPCFA